MESSLQKIIAAIVGVMILFIIPVYIAFEKVDDISYSLVLKFSQSFVDNVREKGYISPEMYSEFIENIYSTNNSYDVQIEHIKKRYDPAIYIYGTNGDILHILDYDKYIEEYNSGKIEVDEGIYTDKNTEIKVVPPSITLGGANIVYNGIEYDPEQLYRDKIAQYREIGGIILEKGTIYADREKMKSLGKEPDHAIYDELYIDSDITLNPGVMTVINTKYEPSNIMSYNDYINNYDNGFELEIAGTVYDVFYGPTFNKYNSRILNTKAAMWISDGRTYNELSAEEKKAAEEMYYDRIDDYKSTDSTAIVNSKGEVYSYSTSPKYEPLTDYLATSIKVSGTIDIKNPATWRATSIEFNDKNILTLRQGGKVIADEGGVFDNVVVKPGTVKRINTNQVFEYNDTFVDDMLNANDTITIERAEVYTNDNIILSDDARVVVKETINIQGKWREVTRVKKSISRIEDYISLVDEFNNEGTVTINNKSYSAEKYTITITEPSRLICSGQAPSNVYLRDNIDGYIEEYRLNKEIVISREYDKEDLEVIYESLELYDSDGVLRYTFTENESVDEYRAYRNEYETNKYITLEQLAYGSSELEVNYDNILILYKDEYNQDKQLILTNNDSNFSKYIDDYYNDQRIVVTEPEIYKDVEVIHPKIEIRSTKRTLLYKYERESKDPEEVALWERYSKEAENKEVKIIYKKSDVDVKRANIVIDILDGGELVIRDNDDSDSNGIYEYFAYFNEFNEKGTITFVPAEYYKDAELEVIDPSVTIYNKQTGEVIKKYTMNFEAENMFESFDKRREEYETKFVIKDNPILYENNKNCLMAVGHTINEERITDKQIINKLFAGTSVKKEEFLIDCLAGNVDLYKSLAYINENSYTMNEGDKIVVTVRNKNKTIASVFYSLFTANVGVEDVSKIYVNYGGTIKNDGATLLSDQNGSIYSEEGRVFKYKGVAEEVTLTPGTYQIECWGASGGGYNSPTTGIYTGGKGAYTKADLTVKNTDQTLYVCVGGVGNEYSEENPNNGGWNGGGNSYQGYGGGGASDIRLIKGETDTDSTDANSLITRVMVAAGGGGSSKEKGIGGYAGNDIKAGDGDTGELDKQFIGKGAIAGAINIENGYTLPFGFIEEAELDYEDGILGIGGKADYLGAGAGGAGLIGGSASHNVNAGGGGGLSYVFSNNLLSNNTYKEIWNYYQENIQNNNEIKKLYTIKSLEDVEWNNISVSNIKILNGNSPDIPNPFTLLSNLKNGYVRIKKIG